MERAVRADSARERGLLVHCVFERDERFVWHCDVGGIRLDEACDGKVRAEDVGESEGAVMQEKRGYGLFNIGRHGARNDVCCELKIQERAMIERSSGNVDLLIALKLDGKADGKADGRERAIEAIKKHNGKR